jgi:hypothetical protein
VNDHSGGSPDRVPSEGRGHKFESCRVRQHFQSIAFQRGN